MADAATGLGKAEYAGLLGKVLLGHGVDTAVSTTRFSSLVVQIRPDLEAWKAA